jgi:hypothetical protein
MMDTRVKPRMTQSMQSMLRRHSRFPIRSFKQPSLRILAAQCVRGLSVPREPKRGDGAAGGARAPAGTLGGGINVPTSRGKAPRAPKAGAAPPGAPPGHQAVDRSGAPRSGQLSLCPLQGRF